jgi:hypothetical protein
MRLGRLTVAVIGAVLIVSGIQAAQDDTHSVCLGPVVRTRDGLECVSDEYGERPGADGTKVLMLVFSGSGAIWLACRPLAKPKSHDELQRASNCESGDDYCESREEDRCGCEDLCAAHLEAGCEYCQYV